MPDGEEPGEDIPSRPELSRQRRARPVRGGAAAAVSSAEHEIGLVRDRRFAGLGRFFARLFVYVLLGHHGWFFEENLPARSSAAGAGGLEPTTCGFGIRCSTN